MVNGICVIRYLVISLSLICIGSVNAQDLDLGLILHYTFNGNVLDVGPNGLHGTLNNAVYTTDESGVPNEALYFNGTTSYVGIPDNLLAKPDFPFTIACMVKYDAPQTIEETQVFGLDFYQNNYYGAWTNLMFGKVEIAFGGGAGGMGASNRRTKRGTTTLNANQWYRITYIIRGATDMDIYIDCVNDGGSYSGTGPTQIAYSNVPGSVGRMDGNTGLPAYYFKGSLSDFRMWDRALTELEITYMCTNCMSSMDVEISAPPVLEGCAPYSVQFNSASSGADALSWDFGEGTTSGQVQPTHVFQVPGTYPVVLTGSNNTDCPGQVFTETDTIFVTVHPAPSVNAGSDMEVCADVSYQLSASGGSSYSWSPSAGLSDPDIADPMVTVSQSATYSVTVTDANGCTSTDQLNLSIFDVNATADQTAVCYGQDVMLTADDGVAWAWSPPLGLDSPSSQNPIAGLHVGEHILVVTANNGQCDAMADVTITVYPLPVADAGPDQSGCLNSSIQLSASGGISYAWAPASGLSSALVNDPVASPSVGTSTYSVTVTDANGCQSTDEVEVTVLPLPELIVSPDQSICRGDSAVLVVAGAEQYAWSPAIGLSDTDAPDPTAFPDSSIQYTVMGTDQNGCQSLDSVTINVFRIAISPSDNSVCLGNSAVLSVSGGTSWVWSPVDGLSALNVQNPVFSPNDTGTFTFSVTTLNAECSDSASITLDVYPLPLASVNSDQESCFGLGAQLSASGGVAYSWTPVAPLTSSTIQDPVAVAAVGTTTFTVTVTDMNGCMAILETDVTVHPLPLVVVGPDSMICSGGNLQLYSTGAMTYSWNPTTGLNDPDSDQPVAQPTVATTYSVSGTDANGCVGVDSVAIDIFSISASPDTVICSGQSVQLSVDHGMVFAWSPSNSLESPHLQSPMASPQVSTTYAIEVESQYGCIATDSVTVLVRNSPVADFSSSVSINCEGLLIRTANNSLNAFSNLWVIGSDTLQDIVPPDSHLALGDSISLTLIVFDQDNTCSDTMSATFDGHALIADSLSGMIGNVITPNGDAINDCFPPSFSDDLIECYQLTVYDRWGLLIFNSEDSDSPCWNGVNGAGTVMEDGTYYYVIQVQGQVISGWVFLKSE